MSLLQQLSWRYATKVFDPDKKLDRQQVDKLLEYIHLSPSSLGLQPYKVLVIQDTLVRKKLQKASRNQGQVVTSSHLLVFATITRVDEAYVAHYYDRVAEVRGLVKEELGAKAKDTQNALSQKSDRERLEWAVRQTYIGLGFLLSGCAEQGIDACPMGGFDPEQYDALLNLKEQHLTATVLAAIGFRDVNDPYAKAAKVRKTYQELFIHI